MHAGYSYCDVWVAGVFKAWQRVEIARCREGFQKYLGKECFQSAQCFSSPVRKGGPEDHWAHYWCDIDDKNRTGKAREIAQQVSRWFLGSGISGKWQAWVETGGGGIHGWISGHALGVEPGVYVTKAHEQLSRIIAVQEGLPTAGPGAHLDLSVYSMPRLMRIPGSTHKSGERARSLSFEDLFHAA